MHVQGKKKGRDASIRNCVLWQLRSERCWVQESSACVLLGWLQVFEFILSSFGKETEALSGSASGLPRDGVLIYTAALFTLCL